MKCRRTIKGRKIWQDNDNALESRPESVTILLYRDGEVYKSVEIDAFGDGEYRFPCLIVWKNGSEKYVYRVDEAEVPIGYRKVIDGFNIINALGSITIEGTKTWDDNFNERGYRPSEITLRLLQNSVEVASQVVQSPPDAESTVDFTFGEMPFADEMGVPYFYVVVEEPVDNYEALTSGFNITNKFHEPIVPFSFSLLSEQTGLALAGGVFALRRGIVVEQVASSDQNGLVSFSIRGQGTYDLEQTLAPEGYAPDSATHTVVVSQAGEVTVDDAPASAFHVVNSTITP